MSPHASSTKRQLILGHLPTGCWISGSGVGRPFASRLRELEPLPPGFGDWTRSLRILVQRAEGTVTNSTPLSTALSAEFLGTFMLVFACAGAAALGAGGLVGVALAQGLALTVAVYLFGHLSGAHVNPAVTVGVWLAGKINTRRAVSYVVFQVFGAVVAALALRFVLGGLVGNLGGTALGGKLEVGDATILVTPAAGLVVESLLTLFLVLAVLQGAIAGRAGHMAGVVIGATLAVGVLVGGPLTGASLNPARTLGPALVTGDFADLWIYLAGPISGGALAALLFRNALGR